MNEEIKPENMRIHSRADELIACLEGEIAKRDARIAEMQERFDSSAHRTSLIGRLEIENDQLRAELAALKAQGVVMPERWNVPRPMWKDARQPYGNPLNHADIEAAEKFNLALDEVARLNAALSAGKEVE